MLLSEVVLNSVVCLPREVCVLEVFKITSLVCAESEVVMNSVVFAKRSVCS